MHVLVDAIRIRVDAIDGATMMLLLMMIRQRMEIYVCLVRVRALVPEAISQMMQ